MDRILKYCTHGFWRRQVVAQATNRVGASRATSTDILRVEEKGSKLFFTDFPHSHLVLIQEFLFDV